MVMRNRGPRGNAKKTLVMIAIAGAMMLVIDLLFLGGLDVIAPDRHVGRHVDVVPSYVPVPVEEYYNLPPESVDVPPEDQIPLVIPEEDLAPDEAAEIDILKWQQYAAAFEPAAGNSRAKVIVIIDDMGLNAKRAQAVMDLPGPLTLAYLPYAPHVKAQTRAARKAGHELMIHTPMEPISPTQDPGPLALMDDMTPAQVDENLQQIFTSFDGYIGINNHMGSLLTQNEAIMHQVMQALKARGLVFIDSKTSSQSVAATVAAEEGIYYAQRDVFLDHVETPEFVHEALAKLEAKAKKRGYAIAIGHPKEVTIEALRAWIPTLADKGLELAPVSVVLNAPPQGQPH